MSYIRKLMRRFGMSAKKATFFHINKASPDEIRAWQKSSDSTIRYHKNRGHALLTEDESHHPYDVKPWQKNWGKIGRKSYIVYPANQKRISMHGILSDDGRQLFRHYNESTADTFIKFLKVAHKKFGDCNVYRQGSCTYCKKNQGIFVQQQRNQDNRISSRMPGLQRDGGVLEGWQTKITYSTQWRYGKKSGTQNIQILQDDQI